MKRGIFFLCISIFLLMFYAVFQWYVFTDGKLHVIFCNVGQGDSIIVKTPTGKIVLIDGGPNEAILSCLSSHTPFWQRQVDLMILSHPHLDHFAGFLPVLERYRVLLFATEDLSNNTQGFSDLLSLLSRKNVPQKIVTEHDRFIFPGGVTLRVIGPSQEFLKRSSPSGNIGDSKEFASLIMQLSFGNTHVVFTGDSQQEELSRSLAGISSGRLFLHVPHHGSATGLTSEILSQKKITAAIISVGAKNRYGHPALSTLLALSSAKIPLFRTDRNGTIEFILDGKEVKLQKER